MSGFYLFVTISFSFSTAHIRMHAVKLKIFFSCLAADLKCTKKHVSLIHAQNCLLKLV